eukprot:364988-Chlamydomonas_euryale.AAC.19
MPCTAWRQHLTMYGCSHRVHAPAFYHVWMHTHCAGRVQGQGHRAVRYEDVPPFGARRRGGGHVRRVCARALRQGGPPQRGAGT